MRAWESPNGPGFQADTVTLTLDPSTPRWGEALLSTTILLAARASIEALAYEAASITVASPAARPAGHEPRRSQAAQAPAAAAASAEPSLVGLGLAKGLRPL